MTKNLAQPPSLFASDQNPLTKATRFILLLQHQIMQIKDAEDIVMVHEGLVKTNESLIVSLAATSSQLDHSIARLKQSVFLGFEASYMASRVNKNPKLQSPTTCPSNNLQIMSIEP